MSRVPCGPPCVLCAARGLLLHMGCSAAVRALPLQACLLDAHSLLMWLVASVTALLVVVSRLVRCCLRRTPCGESAAGLLAGGTFAVGVAALASWLLTSVGAVCGSRRWAGCRLACWRLIRCWCGCLRLWLRPSAWLATSFSGSGKLGCSSGGLRSGVESWAPRLCGLTGLHPFNAVCGSR